MADTVLAEVIRRRGSRQTYLAEAAGVHPSHLNRALRLERPLSAKAIAVIVDLLGVPLDQVYDGQRLLACTPDAPHSGSAQASVSTNAAPASLSTGSPETAPEGNPTLQSAHAEAV